MTLWNFDKFSRARWTKQATFLCLASALAVMLLTSGCGAGAGPIPFLPQPANITMQPTSESVMAGQTAVFNVVATGAAPLSYQWSENGAAIAGATSAAFTTPVVEPGDDKSVFTVTVSNSVNSITSNPATLTVLFTPPRAPQATDLRFQQVDAPSTVNGYVGFEFTNVQAGLGQSFGNMTGSPLLMGDVCTSGVTNAFACVWFFDSFFLPAGQSGLTASFVSGNTFTNFDRDLGTQTGADTVLTSIDVERVHDTYAFSSVKTNLTTGFSFASRSVLPSALQAAATQEGAQSRVITAVSFDGGDLFYVSYGWQNDLSTVYEASVVTATFATIGTVAAGLANQGYIITALEGNSTDGFVLVGTRVKGDTNPRPFRIVPNGSQKTQLWDAGYAIVGFVFNAANEGTFLWLGEK